MESEQANIIPAEIKDSSNPSLCEGQTELDLPPEYCHYRDRGCEFADSCLNCPFPRCIYDQPGGKKHWLKKMRNREMARLFINEGKAVKELASMFGVSLRTVQRVLKKCLSNSSLQREDKKRQS
ncbi:MAG TPA: hypothetical protein G4N93_03865 [Dehalococcoidia bacterium]|nr:hypothetical protein [Dehalococcoidia bacterium]